MQHTVGMLRWLVSFVIVLLVTTFSLAASATEPPPTTARDGSAAFHADLDLGVRSLRFDGLDLRARTAGSTLAVRGDDVPAKGLFETQLRLGLRFHGVMLGVGAGFGVADWGYGRAQPLGDIVVRPNGFVVTGGVLASAGYRYARGPYAARLEGFVGAEMVAIGLDRPLFPDTKIPYANAVRTYFAPRITVERAFDDVSFGLFVQADVVNPGNVFFGISVTPWVRL